MVEVNDDTMEGVSDVFVMSAAFMFVFAENRDRANGTCRNSHLK